jgi:hypothetical protein
MSAPPPVERHQPSFLRFPIQNNRTGFQPVYLPVILIVPGRRTPSGSVLANSGATDVRFFIADAPDPSKVAGPFNTGLLVPQLSRFVVNVTNLQLVDVQIELSGRRFFDQLGNEKASEDAVEGDVFEHTLIRGGTTSTVPFFPDADYYDLSLFTIDVEDLPRPDRYQFVWEARYNRRIVFDPQVASTQGLTCINVSDTSIAQIKFLISHPGEVHHEMFKKTPPFYFDNENFRRADDPILQFYRPFADMLQDIFDEQEFLNGINHINKIPAQLIPYLAFLIGWDLPNFPGVTDEIRRSILRQAVRLQQLKGSRRALVELFDIFGFTIDLVNLWYSTDGTRLIAPEEQLPDTIQSEEIDVQRVCQIDPLIADYNTNGFGEFEIPMLYKTVSDITVTAYLVTDGATRDALNSVVTELTDDPTALEGSCVQSPDGSIVPQALLAKLPGSDPTVIAMSEVTVDSDTGLGFLNASTSSVPLINKFGVGLDRLKNTLTINFDHHLDFDDGSKIFIFATYGRDKLIIPSRLNNLRSNRFDVRILLKSGQEVSPELLEFLLQFVFKLKAFHSLLRKISFDINLIEAYNVIDYCFTQLQVPPPIEEQPEPGASNPCEPVSADRGLKDEDLNLRNAIFDALSAEHETWKALDNTHQSDPDLERFLNLPVTKPIGSECQFTHAGQDRVLFEPNVDLDHNPDQRPKLCNSLPPSPDNCFKGRVKDELFTIPEVILCEVVRCRPCVLGMGSGFYWLFPSDVRSVLRDGFGQFAGQNSISFLGKQIFRFNHPTPHSLHYTNRPYLESFQLESDQLLAYRKPSLEVEKDNLLFPSHRFPTMNRLQNDFTHPIWRAKPWDDPDNDLNAQLVINLDGDQDLIYNDADLVYLGNGALPDISSLGSHDDRDFVVTHKVFLVTEPNHPAIQLDDRIVVTQEESITFDSSTPFGKIFRSYNQSCNQDFRSGYPAQTGRFAVDPSAIDFDRTSITDDLIEGLGVPVRDEVSGVTALFTLGSQILVTVNDLEYGFYIPYRLDCDCTQFECVGTGSTGTGSTGTGSTGSISVTGATVAGVTGAGFITVNLSGCPTDPFRLADGTLDPNCDQLDIDRKMILSEKLGICSTLLDGTISNMLCILDDGIIPDNILPQGSFRYKDDYGVIYEGAWTFTNNVLDITYVTKSPSVWGEEPSGYVTDLRVFRRGIVTTTRQRIRVFDNGTYEILGTSSTQKIETFQHNVACNDLPFVDNFCYHVDCMVQDIIDGIVTCGPRWTEVNDAQVEWADLIIDSNGDVIGFDTPPGIQPMFFINVWGDSDEFAVCPSLTGSGSV